MANGIFGDGSFIGDPSTPTPINAFIQGGNAFGATGVLGTTDAFDQSFVTNGVERGRFTSSAFGAVLALGLATTEPSIALASFDPVFQWFINTDHIVAGGVTDNVMNIGYNCAPGGGPVIAGEPVLRDSWESNFKPAGSAFMERHWQYLGADGLTTRRVLSAAIDRGTHAAGLTIAGSLKVEDSTGVAQRISVPDSLVDVDIQFGDSTYGTGLFVAKNNVAAVSGITSAAVKVPLLKVDNADILQVGDSITTNFPSPVTFSNNITAAAGGFTYNLGAATGDVTFPTGAASWTGAAGKNLSLTASGAGSVSITSGTGGFTLVAGAASTINLFAGANAHTWHIGDGAAVQTVTMFSGAAANLITFGSQAGAASMTIQSGTAGTQFTVSGAQRLDIDTTAASIITAFVPLTIQNANGWTVQNGATATDGFKLIRFGAKSWTLDYTGTPVDTGSLQIGRSNLVNVQFNADVTQQAGGGNVSLPCQNNGTWLGGNTSGSASMTLDAGTGTVNAWTSASARTINVGTGNAVQTINIGTHATPVNIIGIGGAASTIGFYGHAKTALQTGVAVTAAAIHAALVNLGLITA